jgi:streptomycin 6-kinase
LFAYAPPGDRGSLTDIVAGVDLESAAARWSLRLGDPFTQGAGGLTAPATLPDGTPVVLKVSYPHRESEHEADALEVWDGDGAVRLIDRDDSGRLVLLERCFPGSPLSRLDPEDALDVLGGLVRRLWRPADGPFHTLVDEAAWWAEYLPRGWHHAEGILAVALEALRELPETQGEQVLIHQDLHGDNVLAAGREPWLVIDPKPLLGEREFSVAPIVRSSELGERRRDVLHRFDRLTSELSLDRQRARGWTIAQTVAWTPDDAADAEWHLQVARWLIASA